MSQHTPPMLADPALVRDALVMIADPTLRGRTWGQVGELLRLNRYADVDGGRFCAVMHSCWLFARMADAILAGDRAGLLALMDQHDPDRTARDGNATEGATPCPSSMTTRPTT